MYSEILLIALLTGAILMCILVSVQMKWYGVRQWKSIGVVIAIVFTGLVGAEFWFYLENGYWEGRSFFGAVFFAPITFVFAAKVLRIPYWHSLDFCATAGCLILAILKIQCLLEGCCQGIILYVNSAYMYVRFPSAMVELVCALLLTALMLALSRKPKYRSYIYPITLVAYGSIRFVLNFFRDDWARTKQLNLPIPLGNIWSVVAVIIGLTIIQVKRGNNN